MVEGEKVKGLPREFQSTHVNSAFVPDIKQTREREVGGVGERVKKI